MPNSSALSFYIKILFLSQSWILFVILDGSLITTSGSFIQQTELPSKRSCIFYLSSLAWKKYNIEIAGLPWWRSGWESACQCRGHGFEPWSGKIPHAAEWLGPWATIIEPARLEPVLRNKRDRDSERPAHRDEEWPPLAATRESPCTETKTQHSLNKLIN